MSKGEYIKKLHTTCSKRNHIKENFSLFIFLSHPTEDDLSITTLTSQIQTSSPQPATAPTYAINPQNTNFVATHMLGQGYGTENSNFGAIYHHNPHHAYHTSPYHKVATAPPTPANVYGSYQGFYGQMARVDYIPR